MADFIRKDATRRTGAATLTISGTATGESTGTIRYGSGGYGNFGIAHKVVNSTLATTGNFTVQGRITGSTFWTKLTALITPSTAGALIASTASLIVDQIRIQSTANTATSTGDTVVLSVSVVPSVGSLSTGA